MHFLHDLKPILACFRLDSAKTKKLLLVVLFAFFSFFSIGNRDISPLSEHAIEKSENIKIDQFENEITVSFQSPIFEWNLTPGGETISFAGSEILSVPGYPSIPYQSTVLSLPNIDYELDIQTSQAKIIHSPQNLFVLETGNFSSCNSTYPNSSIEVGDPFWYRDQYLVSITFYPILWDCNLNEFIWNQDLEISFKFEQNLSFEEENNKTLVDPILSDQENIGWKTDPPVLWGGDLRSSWSERVKIEVQEDGIYQVSYEDLHTIGFLNDFIDPHYIHIENQGREVATLFDGNDDNIFEPGESLLFYGQEFDGDYLAGLYQQQDDNWPEYNNWQPEFSHYMLEKYTETNIYWLYLSDTTGSRIQSQDRTPINTETITTFTDQVQFEEETVWWTTHFTNEDTWFWEDQKIYSFPEQFSYSIWLDDPVIAESVSTNLRADTISVTSSSSTSPDHHIQAFLNNQLFADQYWDGAMRISISGTLNQKSLVNGENQFSYVFLSQGLPYSRYVFDFLNITYERYLKAVDNQLIFNINQVGDIEVSGFTSGDNVVWNITNPLQPVEIKNYDYLEGKLLFTQPTTEPQHYVVMNRSALIAVSDQISLYQPTDLLSPENHADYLIISPKEFQVGLTPLINYRESQGLDVKWVDIQDIYNQFNFGITHPIAIKNFFGYTYQYWQDPTPLYVLLVGDAHWDLKNLRTEEGIYIPPNFVWVDPLQGEVDSLSDLVAVVGDDIFPDAMIGRMPVNNLSELAAYVDKTIAFETSKSETWRNLSFIADNYYLQDPVTYTPCTDEDPLTICPTDPAGNFPAILDQVIEDSVPQTYQVNRIYLDDYNCRSAGSDECLALTREIIDSFNSGTQIITFSGHGAINTWTAERIFDVNQITGLNNIDYPIVFSLDCVDGYWYYPQQLLNQTLDRRSLSEELTRVSDKGAVAILSSPGNGYVNGHEMLLNGFYEAFSSSKDPTLGELDLYAKLNLMTNYGNPSMVFTYMIFGDPAIQISQYKWETFLPWITK